MEAIIIGKNAPYCERLKADIANQSNCRVHVCRTLKQAVTIAQYRPIGAVYMPQSDLIMLRRAKKQFRCQLQQYPISTTLKMPTSFLDGIAHRVFNILGLWQKYLAAYRPREIPVLVGQLALVLAFKTINIFKKIVLVELLASRIGHLAFGTHVYLCKRDQTGDKRAIVAIVMNASNDQLVECFRHNFTWVFRSTKWVKRLRSLPFQRSGLYQTLDWHRDIDEPLYLYELDEKIHVKFTDEEEQRGRALLNSMGISKDDWYVCIHSRDPAYLAECHSYKTKDEWSYHDYRDCHIANYLEAAQWITEQGGFVVRMGAAVENALPDTGNPKIIDYATQHRSGFGDIYVTANCKFLLGAGCGLTQVATVFGVPVAVANYPILEYTTNLRANDLYIPKLIYSLEMERYVTFKEMLDRRISTFSRSEQFVASRLRVDENTPDDILDLCQQMYWQIEGIEVEPCPDGDELLAFYRRVVHQQQFRCHRVRANIGTGFLCSHRELLGLAETGKE